MNNIEIQTSQNINIEYQTASIADRIYAVLIDIVVMLAYLFVAYTIVNAISDQFKELLSIGGLDVNTVDLIIMTPVLFYHLITELTMNGQSVGKLLMKIKVANIEGGQPTLGAYLIRWLFRNVEANPILYFTGVYLLFENGIFGILLAFSGTIAIIVMVVNARGQRIGDILANTTVIKLKKNLGVHELDYVTVGQDYEPVFPQASQLKESDVQLIMEIMKENDQIYNVEVNERLADKIKEMLQVRTGMPPRKFLKTILKDYYHYYLNTASVGL